jgi:hypothetical protein
MPAASDSSRTWLRWLAAGSTEFQAPVTALLGRTVGSSERPAPLQGEIVNDDIFERAPDWWIVGPWPLPEPMTAEQYQRDAIADADDDEEPEDLG